MRKLQLISLILILLLFCRCESRRPYVGVIRINTDLPVQHRGKLPIGVTLDPGSGGRDLLSPNMLLNGSFDLANRLPGCAYDLSDSTLITPNGFRLFFPLPQHLYGWEVLGGNMSVVGSAENYHLQVFASTTDSLTGLKQSVHSFSVQKGEQYSFTAQSSAIGDARVFVTLVDEAHEPVSNQVTLTPTSELSELRADLTITEEAEQASLLIEFKVEEGEPYFVETDSISYWSTRRRATIHLDDCALYPAHLSMRAGVSSELYTLLDSISPSFLRYPSGRTANGYYPGSYPLHLDSLERKPLWTLGENEWHGDFGYKELLELSRSLGSTPTLVANFGYTDATTFQRVEGSKKAEKRFEYIAELFQQASPGEVAIQAGYNLSGSEYAHRFMRLLAHLDAQAHDLQLISASSLQGYERYSDYPFDRQLPVVSYSSLPEVEKLLLQHDYMLYPQMISEVTFESNYLEGYFLPPLALRAIFMLLAERLTASIVALGITPLLSDNIEQDFPLIEVTGGHYKPTLFYQFLLDFQSLRGDYLRRLPEGNDIKSDIYLSLTSNLADEYYYLKSVNVTRHPLHYKIELEGMESRFERVEIISYTTRGVPTSTDLEGFTHYERSISQRNLSSSSSFSYLFQPYEVTLFKLKKK